MIGTNKLYKSRQTDRYEMVSNYNYLTEKKIYGIYRVFSDGSTTEADYFEERAMAKQYLNYKNASLEKQDEQPIRPRA